jgi:hypothetical protein
MARSNFALKLDVADLVRRSGRLDRFTGEDLGRISVEVLNETIDAVYEEARDRMVVGINMSDNQLRRPMRLEHATAALPTATLKAIGPSKGAVKSGILTGLSHYAPEQRMQPVKNPSRSRGDQARGISRGSKTAGVSVEVTRGGRKGVRRDVFIMPDTKDTQGNPLVFERVSGRTASGKTKIRRLLGPSVYQLFRYQLEHGLLGETADTLEAELADRLQDALQDAIE